jgi:NAD(P)-dependent dehydrogenase (short-subunit alcohol dehydrogenase family)
MPNNPPYDTSVRSKNKNNAREATLLKEINPQQLSRLCDRTAIVTGSTRGIGEGIARRFASEGANVIISGRSVQPGKAIATDICDAGGEATFIKADMGKKEDIKDLINQSVSEYGEVDILVNNAAAWNHGSFRDRDVSEWEQVMDVSLRGPWLATKYAIEHFSSRGRVINISSIHAHLTDPDRFPYNVAKGGVNVLTRSMAIDLRGIGVTVNTISPGRIIVDASKDQEETGQSRYASLAPAGRCGVPEDVAAMAAFLATDESEFITGANIPVDGGWTACLFADIEAYGISD